MCFGEQIDTEVSSPGLFPDMAYLVAPVAAYSGLPPFDVSFHVVICKMINTVATTSCCGIAWMPDRKLLRPILYLSHRRNPVLHNFPLSSQLLVRPSESKREEAASPALAIPLRTHIPIRGHSFRWIIRNSAKHTLTNSPRRSRRSVNCSHATNPSIAKAVYNADFIRLISALYSSTICW